MNFDPTCIITHSDQRQPLRGVSKRVLLGGVPPSYSCTFLLAYWNYIYILTLGTSGGPICTIPVPVEAYDL